MRYGKQAKLSEGELEMAEQKYEIGMVGLGVMGRNLVLNIADHGYSVSGYDKICQKLSSWRQRLEAVASKLRRP